MGHGQRGKPVPSTSGSSYSLEQGSRLGVLSQPLSKPAIAELSDGNHAAHGKQSLVAISADNQAGLLWGRCCGGGGGGGSWLKLPKVCMQVCSPSCRNQRRKKTTQGQIKNNPWLTGYAVKCWRLS